MPQSLFYALYKKKKVLQNITCKITRMLHDWQCRRQRSVFLFLSFFTQNAAVSSDSFNLKASHHCLTPRGSHTPELGYFKHFLWLIRRPHLPFAAMQALTSGCHPAGAVLPPHWHTWSASGVAKGQANSSRGHRACLRVRMLVRSVIVSSTGQQLNPHINVAKPLSILIHSLRQLHSTPVGGWCYFQKCNTLTPHLFTHLLSCLRGE